MCSHPSESSMSTLHTPKVPYGRLNVPSHARHVPRGTSSYLVPSCPADSLVRTPDYVRESAFSYAMYERS
jgi:hypothetical protein